jgi:hypothetical protein
VASFEFIDQRPSRITLEGLPVDETLIEQVLPGVFTKIVRQQHTEQRSA